jgi:microcystin-dependent protein
MQPYLGEIRMFAGTFAPQGWFFCDGTLLPISQFDTLFALIGTTYGGDGQETFALPDLRGRVPLHPASPATLGGTGGSEEVTLTVTQVPSHSHPLVASTAAGGATPAGKVLGTSTAVDVYRESSASVALAPSAITPAGGSQPHTNFQPYLCLNFIIAWTGVFPPQN